MSPERASRAAVILARYKARQIIRDRYREAGRKLQSVSTRELRDEADVWLKAHPELIDEARVQILQHSVQNQSRGNQGLLRCRR
jgi:hypothetical protein